MKTVLLITFLLPVFSYASPIQVLGTGAGGAAECTNLATQVALLKYTQTTPLAGVPALDLRLNTSECSPSNGIDIAVKVNGQIFCVVATSVSTSDHRNLLGCKSARIDD